MNDSIKDVAAMSMTSFDETVSVKVISEQQLLVHLDNLKNEWRINNGPASNYEQAYFRFELQDAHGDCLLTLKQPSSLFRIMRYSKKHWQIIEMKSGKTYSTL